MGKVQRRERNISCNGATLTGDLTVAGCYTLSSENPSVVSVDASGVLHALGNGTTLVVVRFSGLSNSVPITVTGGQMPPLNYVAMTQSGGVNTVSFRGTPGTSYRIQRTTDLTAPVTWTTLSTQTAPPSGIIAIQDTNPPAGQAFYRAITPYSHEPVSRASRLEGQTSGRDVCFLTRG